MLKAISWICKGETVMDNLKKMHDMLNAARSVLGLDLTLD